MSARLAAPLPNLPQPPSATQISPTHAAMTRRAAVRLGAGGVAATLAARGARPAAAKNEPATFVLVHGAWGGAWIWRDVITHLREAGHNVYATTATGMGDRYHLADAAINLDVYITDVVNVLEYEDLNDVILVGWSFGGMIITGVAERVPERLSHVVYFDAAVPADGESAADVFGMTEEGRVQFVAGLVASGVAEDLPGFVPVAFAEEWLRSITPDPTVQEWIFTYLTPQPLPTWVQPIQIGNPDAAAVPHVYIYCTEAKDPAADVEMQIAEQLRADPAWTVVDLVDTHMAPVNDPLGSAEVLMSLL